MDLPKKLYKYLPAQFVNSTVLEGDLMFRNLSYFRQCEDNRRGDPLEGFHRDNPDNDIVMNNLSTGKIIKGDFSYLNSTNTDLIYVYCLSKIMDKQLFHEFQSETCIEIFDVDMFLRRVAKSIRNMYSISNVGLLHGDVKYYKENVPAGFDIKDPKNLPFAKGVHYKHQEEFRLVFGVDGAFNLTQQLVINKRYDFIGEAQKGVSGEMRLNIGSIKDIIKIHSA